MTSEQAFKILGIKDRNIDEALLKKAFHSAARKNHPDSNPKDAQAQAKFHQINEAYEVLREYLKYISDCEFLTTSVIPIGNGVAISYKEKEYEKN